MGECCHVPKNTNHEHNHDHGSKKKFDYILWGSIFIILVAYFSEIFFPGVLGEFSKSTFELINKMWIGIVLGILFVGLLDKIPREFVISILGKGGTFSGILRATGAGVLLDLCSHGILMVGMKLYERGASLGQVMAFLIASPWNSISLTIILFALIGFKLTILFLLLSMVIAVISGLIFEKLVSRGVLPSNPNKLDIRQDFDFFKDAKSSFKGAKFNLSFFKGLLSSGISGSEMVLKWIFFGVVLASLIRTFMPIDMFQTYFGPSIVGLGLTIVVATILEVCSEGSTPIAADLVTRAGASGNGFAFLMTGVSTDYTEMLSLKETTKSWKISFFLPLVTLPQVILIALLLNYNVI